MIKSDQLLGSNQVFQVLIQMNQRKTQNTMWRSDGRSVCSQTHQLN